MVTGIVALSDWGVLNISGPDAKSFLQGQLLCHMEEITPTQGILSGHCNLQGRLQSLFYLFMIKEHNYALVMPREMVPLAHERLKRYALFSKVVFSDSSDNMPVIGLQNVALPTPLSEDYSVQAIPTQPHRHIVLWHTPAAFLRYEKQEAQSLARLSSQEWERADIEAGIPMVYPATIDSILPHHANLIALGGVSFKKGCYLGQEIIARMHYRGNIKKHLHCTSIKSDTLPMPGDRTVDAGVVLRAAPYEGEYLIQIII